MLRRHFVEVDPLIIPYPLLGPSPSIYYRDVRSRDHPNDVEYPPAETQVV